MVTVQVKLVPAALQALPQPAKTVPGPGLAVSCTLVPMSKEALHGVTLVPQLMPAGTLVTVPLAPLAMVGVTLSVARCTKVAVICWAESVMVKVQSPVPLQALKLQPAKRQPAGGVALRVTELPLT